MSKSRLEWRVGLFVAIGLGLLAALMIQFSKGTSLFRKTYNILLPRAGSVGGLKPKSSVLMAGVQVGTVSDIRLGPEGTNVTITLRLFREYTIHKDARFVLEQSGFLGDQYVAIIPTRNTDGVFADGEVAIAEPQLNIQEVARAAGGFLQRIDETASRVNGIITNLSQVLLNERTLTNLAVAAANLRTVSEEAVTTLDQVQGLLATNGPYLSQSGSNLVSFSERLNGVADRLHEVVETNAPTVNASVKNIEHATEVLNTLVENVQAGKGLAGNLLVNEQMAQSVSQITHNLSITTSNLNRLGLWGILWQHKPPRSSSSANRDALESPKKKAD